jgi:hypothetical protein
VSIQNVGTPDWQRGVVGTQKVLATLSATDNATTVGVPPNSEAIIIIVQGPGPFVAGFTVVGNQSGSTYSAFRIPRVLGTDSSAFVVTVSPTIDQTVTVGTTTAPGVPWSVVSESAGRFVVDLSTSAVSGNEDDLAGTSGILVMGEDVGGSAHLLRVDSLRRLVTAGATAYTGLVSVPNGAVLLLPGLGSGHYYIMHAELMNTSGVALAINIETGTGQVIAATTIPPTSTLALDLDGLAVNDQINAVGNGIGGYVTMRYATGF